MENSIFRAYLSPAISQEDQTRNTFMAKRYAWKDIFFATTKAKLLKCISSELSMQSLALEVHNLAKGLAYSIK